MIVTLERRKRHPVMGIMLTVSLVVHLFVFIHLTELYRKKSDFKRPKPPVTIEVTMQALPKMAPKKTVMPSPVTAPPSPRIEEPRITQPVKPAPLPEPAPVIPEPAKTPPVPKKVVKEKKKAPVKKTPPKIKPVKLREVSEKTTQVALPSPPNQKMVEQVQSTISPNAVSSTKPLSYPKVTSSAQAASQSQLDEISSKAYFNAMRLKIEKNKHYPSISRRRHQQGSVRVRFIIDNEGNVGALEIVGESEYESLNRAAIDAVIRSAPFAKPPKSVAKGSLKLELTIQFKLI